MQRLMDNWERILSQVKYESDMSMVAYETWLLPLKIFDMDTEKIYITTPNELTSQHIKRKFLLFFDIAVAEIMGKRYQIEFVAEQKDKKSTVEEHVEISNIILGNSLNTKYTFETFVVGDANRFAHAAALAVAELPGEAYNPLFIHGGPGLGKTHLVQAIGQFIAKSDPEKKIIYVTSEAFTNEVIETIRTGGASDISKLREKYRTCDVLIIDDIQFLIGKESTQQEFFHTFNELHSAGKQVIITSDRPPKELTALNERIISRCEWGLMTDIGIPSFQMRMDILRNNVQLKNMKIADEVLFYIANHFKTNIRELEGALTRLIAYTNLTKEELTLDVAERELSYYISPDEKQEVTPKLIIETVAEHYRIPVEHIISKKRNACIVKPRHVAMYICHELTEIPLDLIGSSFGKRDHSTVLYACNKVGESLVLDKQLESEIDIIKKKICPN